MERIRRAPAVGQRDKTPPRKPHQVAGWCGYSSRSSGGRQAARRGHIGAQRQCKLLRWWAEVYSTGGSEMKILIMLILVGVVLPVMAARYDQWAGKERPN